MEFREEQIRRFEARVASGLCKLYPHFRLDQMQPVLALLDWIIEDCEINGPDDLPTRLLALLQNSDEEKVS